MKGLENMTALILAEAEKAAEKLLSDAKIEADAIVAAYQRQAEEERVAETAKTMQENRSMLERAESSARQFKRNAQLAAKSELLDAAFAAALKELTNLPDNERLELYSTIFRSVLQEQLETEKIAAENDPFGEYVAPSAYTLLLSEKDHNSIGSAFWAAASALTKPACKEITLSERTAPINGGFILVCGDVELDCALGGYMEQIRSQIEGEVCQILFA